jgi:Planctomycete cytochrome C
MMTIRQASLPALLFLSSLMNIACTAEHKPGYTADVRPILDKHCAECHMPDMEGAQKSGFQIDSYASIMKGTKFGPVIVPGAAESSTLYILVAGKANPKINMPHGREPLSATEIDTIRLWIDQGALDN